MINEDFIDKRDTFVDYPLSRLLLDERTPRQKTQSSEYKLYAVINHHSYSQYGGHYTVFIKIEDNLWVHCNDHILTCVAEKDVKTRDAYLLFYRRTVLTSSNVINLTF